MSDVVVYTANMGYYDEPRPFVAQDIDVDWRYYTDGTQASQVARALGWDACRVDPQHDTSMMEAKWWKMHPPVGYEHAIWLDANMEVTSPAFAREAVQTLRLPGAAARDHGLHSPFAVWRHPRRDDLYGEIIASLGAESQGGKYDEWVRRMIEQGEAYEHAGMPEHFGLYACGTIVWTPEAWPLARAWWDECEYWTPQDQVSLPFVCWARGERPAVFPLDQIDPSLSRRQPYLANRWLRIWPHG